MITVDCVCVRACKVMYLCNTVSETTMGCSHRAQRLADILSSKGLPAVCISGETGFAYLRVVSVTISIMYYQLKLVKM